MKISTFKPTASDKTTPNKRDIPKKGYHEIAKINIVQKIDRDRPLPSFYSLVTEELDSDEPPTTMPMHPTPSLPIPIEIKTNSISCIKEIKAPRHSDILSLIDNIGAEMILMNTDGVQETTLKLGNKYPSGSILNGLEIIISEFNTAPKIFNIKLICPYPSIEKITPHIPQIIQVFRERKFDFSVNRIDTEISSDKPLFCRKHESENDSHSDQQGSTNQ